MALHNIQLATVVLYHDMSTFGARQIISGPEGEERGVGSCIGAAMERLNDGITMSLPLLNENGKMEWGPTPNVLVRGWIICLAADYPAAAACCGFKMSTSARCFCRQCQLDQTEKSKYPKACSFISQPSLFNLRTQQSHARQRAVYDRLQSPQAKSSYLMETGVQDFVSPMHRVPHFDVTTMAPQDIMHVLAEGVLKTEIAALIFMLCRKRKWGVTVTSVNAACARYAWPQGHQPPLFKESLLEGQGKGANTMPKRGCHIHGTAGAVLDFTLHSLVVLRPLVKDATDAVWRCWKLMVAITMACMQHSFSRAHVELLDRLIVKHQQLFLSIPEYAHLFKPKHHFCSHIPLDILRFGPARHYWCMRFEAMNQVFKQIAKGGSFRDTCKRCAEFFSLRGTLGIRYGLHERWGETHSVSGDVVESITSLPPDDGTPHNSVARFFYERRERMGVSADGALDIHWVQTLIHEGCKLTADESWIFYKLSADQPAASTTHNSPTLAMIHRIAEIKKSFYVVLHVFPYTTIPEDDEAVPLIQMSASNSSSDAHQPAIFPLLMLIILPTWRVPAPEKPNCYRFVPRIFG